MKTYLYCCDLVSFFLKYFLPFLHKFYFTVQLHLLYTYWKDN